MLQTHCISSRPDIYMLDKLFVTAPCWILVPCRQLLKCTDRFLMVLQGPPPGFSTPLVQLNGRASTAAPPSSEALSAAMDQQDQSWHPQQHTPHLQPHPWLSQPSEQHSSSSPLASYQANAFAMPSLSSGLHSLWNSQGNSTNEGSAQHSLFSGSPHAPAFPQNQFRQQSRFQFAQELAPGGPQNQQTSMAPMADSHSIYQQGQQQRSPQQQPAFRQDPFRSYEAIHAMPSQQAASSYHTFPRQSSNGKSMHRLCRHSVHYHFTIALTTDA